MGKLALHFVLYFVFISVGVAIPTGAPKIACENMTPLKIPHGDPSEGEPPFEYSVQAQNNGNQLITIKGDGEHKFKGFFLQARFFFHKKEHT